MAFVGFMLVMIGAAGLDGPKFVPSAVLMIIGMCILGIYIVKMKWI